ncbi:PRC-barrel domain-containing protein [Azospirillum sp.]|uniref:PRC-barrel domain-containing protein n=1 Tax=Azospirillum sp. TaxID=34012 RepID=UPI003D71F99F
MRTDLIAATAALALIAGGAQAQTNTAQPDTAQPDAARTDATTAPASPAVGETSQSFGVLHPENFLEKSVMTTDGQMAGTVEDVLLGPDGQPLRLIVSTGSGGKDVSIELSRVEVRSDSDALFVSGLTREEVQTLPAFEGDAAMTSLNATRPK